MQTAFILFDNVTALDFVGVYDPLTRLRSMELMPEFDLVVVPGGYGTRS